jgi:hypothetical protein
MTQRREQYVKPAVMRLRFEADSTVSLMANCKNFNDSSGNNLSGGTCDNDNSTGFACNAVGS